MRHVCWRVIRVCCRVAHISGACAYFPLSNLWNCNILACSVWSSGWNRTHSESIFQFWRIWKRIDDRKTISYIWYMQIFLMIFLESELIELLTCVDWHTKVIRARACYWISKVIWVYDTIWNVTFFFRGVCVNQALITFHRRF